MAKTYFIKTFGCQQNMADSERISAYLEAQAMKKAKNIYEADQIIINTCMVRQSAEDRVYGLANNIKNKILKIKNTNKKARKNKPKIIVTGCMVGMAVRDKTGRFLKLLKKRLPMVDEFLPIEEIGFDHAPLRIDRVKAWVPVSNGCNNFCTFCVVPFSRGREISRPYEEILAECYNLAKSGYKKITLLGMNVNSYGADLIVGKKNIQVMRDYKKKYFYNNSATGGEVKKGYRLPNGRVVRPILVKHLGRLRIPTLFPYLLQDVCKIEGIKEVDFLSSNPWDFSDKLIDVISKNAKITRLLHIPMQSGSNSILKKMNRWYTKEEYLKLIKKIKKKIPEVKFSTDIIVGFCNETEKEFLETVDLVKRVGFYKAYIAMYSDRPMTTAHKVFCDDVSYGEKKRRWKFLEELINQPRLNKRE